MLARVFMQIVGMSLRGSLVILAVMLIRLLLKRAPKIYSYLLWAVVLFRLLCPVSISSPISVVPEIPVPSVVHVPTQTATVQLDLNENWQVTYVESIPEYQPVQQDNSTDRQPQISVFSWIAFIMIARYVWIAGIFGLMVYSIAVYLKLRFRLIGAQRLRTNVYLSERIPSAFVLGIIRPRIYLPTFVGENELGYILAHEQHHIKRLDHITKLLGYMTLMLHWFNPLVWFAYILFCKDMEMSCDEAVIKKLGSQIRADYAASLLNLSTGHTAVAVMPLAFGEGDTKGRVKNMSKWKKPKLWICIAAAVLILGTAAVLITDPMDSDEPYDYSQLNPVDPGENIPDGIVDIIQSWAGWTGEGPVWVESLNALKLQYSNIQHLPIHKFDTRQELEDFMGNVGKFLTMNDSSKGVPSFYGTASRYDEAFFKDYSLVLVYIPSGNSGRSFRVSGITVNHYNASFAMHIEETASAQIKEIKESGWFITAAVPDSLIADCTDFDADLTNFSVKPPQLTYFRAEPGGSFFNIDVPLPATDLSVISEVAKQAIKIEWDTYDRLPEFDRSLSSHLWGCVNMYADSWQEAQSVLNMDIKNPLESASYLKKGNHMDGREVTPEKRRVQMTFLATGATNRQLGTISLRTGYTMDDVRITFHATVWNQGGIYQTGGGHSEEATFLQGTAVTGSKKDVLLVQSDKIENYCTLDAYWVDGNVLYNIYLTGQPGQQEQLQKVMNQLLAEV